MIAVGTPRAQKEKQPALPVLTVRGLLILQGWRSLRAWSLERGYKPEHVHMAIRGKRAGRVALEITRRLREELGL